MVTTTAKADLENPLNFRESDGSPDTYPYQVKVSNGTLTDNSDGTITISTGGGSGTPGGGSTSVQFNQGDAFSGDNDLLWYQESNTLVISRDSGQTTQYALIISQDNGALLANITHDGSAFFQSIQLNTALAVDEGGTGASTFTDGGILLGSGTGAITALGVATNGQIPIGDGSGDPVLANISGTASEIEVGDGAGTITIGLVDPLAIGKGGTGAALVDPGADRIYFWDESSNTTAFLTAGSGLTITDTTITASGSGITKAGTTGFITYISSDNTNISSDTSLQWDETNNILVISRDNTQIGPALIISSDTGGRLANISHDGNAYFNLLEVGSGISVDESIYLGIDGVIIEHDGDGALRLTGNSTGNDENLTINLDDGINIVTFSSNTSVNTYEFRSGGATVLQAESTSSSNPTTLQLQAAGDDWDLFANGSGAGTPNTFFIQNDTDSVNVFSADGVENTYIGSGGVPTVKILTAQTGVGSFVVPSLTVSSDLGALTANISPDGSIFTTSTLRSNRSTDFGWSVKTAADTACNTTCIDACVFGEDTAVVGTIVACTDASADVCVCAGAN